MAKIEFCLNNKRPGNYGFFCPVSRLHLTLSNPIDSINADRVTSFILRGLNTKAIIDIRGVVDLETGELKSNPVDINIEKEEVKEKVKPEVKPEAAMQSQVEESESKEAEVAPETDTKPAKKGKKEKVEKAAPQSEE